MENQAKKIPRGLALDYIYGTQLSMILQIALRKVHMIKHSYQKFNWGMPNGSYIVTKDELPTPENVNIVTKVNNEIRQDGNTGEMILK